MKLRIHSQTSTVAPFKYWNGQVISPHTYNGCNYLSMLGLKLIHVSKRGYLYTVNIYHQPVNTALFTLVICHSNIYRGFYGTVRSCLLGLVYCCNPTSACSFVAYQRCAYTGKFTDKPFYLVSLWTFADCSALCFTVFSLSVVDSSVGRRSLVVEHRLFLPS